MSVVDMYMRGTDLLYYSCRLLSVHPYFKLRHGGDGVNGRRRRICTSKHFILRLIRQVHCKTNC